ncbi:MAG: thioesterase family protein [Candidatus Competibacteraceae bacterium]|jgi:acyl-CoA thioesterase FadM|nr:thioesterase family protein [Candidatus Competibacteraceae bacterium]
MARLQLDLPESFAFATEIPLRVTDMNYAGHLGNDTLVSLLQEARSRFMASRGLDPAGMDVFGAGLVIGDSAVIYKSEAFYGETLIFEATAADFNPYGCDFVYRISEKTSQREVARAKTGLVFFDYQARRVCHVPSEFRTLFEPSAVVV